MENKLIKALREKQKELNLSDEKFASLLGVTRGAWAWAMRGQFNPTSRFLSGIIKAFPDLENLIIEFLNSQNIENELQAS